MDVEIVEDVDESIHCDGTCGLIHLDEKYQYAENHPEIKKHKPCSRYGESYLAKFDNSEYFTWIKPVAGGTYKSCNPVFKVAV